MTKNLSIIVDNALQSREKAFNVLRGLGVPNEILYSVCLIPDDVIAIYDVAKDRSIKSILEVGSYVGVSAVVLLTLFEQAEILCIDPSLSIKSDVEQYGGNISETTGYYFHKVAHELNLESRISRTKAFFSKSPDEHTMAYHLPNNPDMCDIPVISAPIDRKFDLIFIDADHYAESVNSNLILTTKMLSDEGIIFLHDVCGKWGQEVTKGANMFIADHPEYTFKVHKTVGVVCKK